MDRKPSGRFVIRIDPALHADLRRTAARRKQSLNAYCESVLQREAGAPAISGSRPAPVWMAELEEAAGGALVGMVLFGSAARGDAWADSDIDVLVVLETGTRLHRGLYNAWDERDAHGPSPHFVTLPAESEDIGSLWLEAAIDGIVLRDDRGRTEAVLRRVRRQIAAGRYIRSMAHGHPYWKLSAGGDPHAK